MGTQTVGIESPGSDIRGIDANVAGVEVTVSRKEVKRESWIRKVLAMLANTLLTVRLTAREDISTGQIYVDTEVRLIVAPNPNRLSVILRNTASGNVYIGSDNVTSTTGYVLRQWESVTLDKTWGGLYAIAETTANVSFIEE